MSGTKDGDGKSSRVGKNEVALLIGGQRFEGWQELRITRGVEIIPSSFDFEATQIYPGRLQPFSINPGAECQVSIGENIVLTGFVDRYSPSLSKKSGHSVRIMGRGKCQDLVDCSAYLRGLQNQVRAASSRKVIEALCNLFGITVTARDGDGEVVPQFNVILTETCWDIIDRVARHSQMLAYEGADGNLILSRVARESMSSGLQEGTNIERAAIAFSMDQRYSLYEAVFMTTETLADVAAATGNQGYNTRARALDETVGADQPKTGRRFRPLVITAEVGFGTGNPAERRANWEKARRYGRSQAIRVTTDSWRDKAGRLWEPNTFLDLDLPSMGLKQRSWLISEVTYSRGREGTHADLVLMPKEAFEPQPILLQPFDRQVAEALAQNDALRAGGAFRTSGTGPGV